MTYNFVKYQGKNKKHQDRITITKSGGIGFPKDFYDNNDISKFNDLVLFWDEAAHSIAIHFTADSADKYALRIAKSKNNYGASIIAKGFFKENKIDYVKYAGRYDWKKETIDGIGVVYIITLEDKGVLVAS